MKSGTTISRRAAMQLIAASGAFSQPSPARSQGLTTVRVGASLDDGLTPLLYALHAGLFQARGLDVHLQSLSNGAVLATAVASNTVDIGKASLMVLITAYGRGIHFKLVAGAAMHTPGDVSDLLCVAKDSPLTSMGQANGKTIIVNVLQSLDQFGTEGLVDKLGGNSSTVKFIELPFTAMVPALQQGRADIASIGNPQLTVALEDGKVRSLGMPYDGIATHFLIAGWFCSQEFAAASRSVCRRFGEALRQATLYTNAHHDEVIPIIADYSHIELDVLKKIKTVVNAPFLDTAEIQPCIDAAVKYKLLDRSFPAKLMLA